MKIKVCDSTLRDAKFAPSIFFNQEEQLYIAELLDQVGVEEVELGIPTDSDEEFETIKAITSKPFKFRKSCVFFCTNSKNIEKNINRIVDSGCDAVCISIPTSKEFIDLKLRRSPKATIALMKKAVKYAVEKGLYVIFSGEDASRADMDFLIEYVKVGEEYGASRFRFAETVSCLEPKGIRNYMNNIQKNTNIELEIHSHSGYGLGLANAIASFDEGVSWVSTTVNGIGERGGNTNLIEILMYLYQFKNQKNYNISLLKTLSNIVSCYSQDTLSRFTPIVGDAVFEYEILNQYTNADSYEHFSPEEVGNHRKLVLGKKMSGKTLEYWDIDNDSLEKNRYNLEKYFNEHKKPICKELLIHKIKGGI
ncbi:hypothetical protein [Bacillus cereus]|uniref:hypothetical protein n=1 Tax=Bacillus cereus TaxID=1396 RepID=UPI003980B4ED